VCVRSPSGCGGARVADRRVARSQQYNAVHFDFLLHFISFSQFTLPSRHRLLDI